MIATKLRALGEGAQRWVLGVLERSHNSSVCVSFLILKYLAWIFKTITETTLNASLQHVRAWNVGAPQEQLRSEVFAVRLTPTLRVTHEIGLWV